MSVAARKLAQEREAEKRVECPVCLGSGHDKQQTWPPGKRGEDGRAGKPVPPSAGRAATVSASSRARK